MTRRTDIGDLQLIVTKGNDGRCHFSGSVGDVRAAEALRVWASRVLRWARHKDSVHNGGKRWILRRPGPDGFANAVLMDGSRAITSAFKLVRVGFRATTVCACCRRMCVGIHGQTKIWKQAPGEHAGQSSRRFCESCVDNGGTPVAPTLELVHGGGI